MAHQIDDTRLKQHIFLVLGAVLMIGAVFATIKMQNPFLMSLVIGIPFIVPLLSRIDLLYIATGIAGIAGIAVPGFSELQVALVLQAALVGVCVLQTAINTSVKIDTPVPVAIKRLLIAFVIVIFTLMAVRGSGVRVLGSRTWGGTQYIYMLLSITFMLVVVPRLRLTSRQIRIIIWGGFIASIFASIMQRFGFVEMVAESTEDSVGASRITWLAPLAYACMPIVCALKPKKFIRWGLMFLILVLLMLTGFRSRMVGAIVIFWLFELSIAKNKRGFMGFSFIAGIFGWLLAIITSPYLPRGMQRAISFIPGTTIDAQVMANAEHSVEWRVEVWKVAMDHFDQYWLIGRGITFDVFGFIDQMGASLSMGFNDPMFVYLSHSYHSGPITMLIDFGVAGAVIFLLFTIAGINFALKVIKKIMAQNTFEHRYLLYLCCAIIWQYLAFWLVYGQTQSVAPMISAFSVICIVYRSVIAKQTDFNS